MRRRILAASLLVTLVGCSSGSSSAPPTTTPPTTTPPATTAAATTAAATTTAATRPSPATTTRTTTVTSTTRPRATTTTAAPAGDPTTTTAGASTTNVPAAPCGADTLLAAAQQAFGPLPDGAAATDPRCVENYATAVLTAPGQDNALAVFDNPEGEWIGRNLGTDQVCSAAGVPLDFFGPLGCGPWEG